MSNDTMSDQSVTSVFTELKTPNLSDGAGETPEDDKYQFGDYADTIIRIILTKKKTFGTVIAINGIWGSGKTTLIKIIKYKLKEIYGESETNKQKSNQICLICNKLKQMFSCKKTSARKYIDEVSNKIDEHAVSTDSISRVEVSVFNCWLYNDEERLATELINHLKSLTFYSEGIDLKNELDEQFSNVIFGTIKLSISALLFKHGVPSESGFISSIIDFFKPWKKNPPVQPYFNIDKSLGTLHDLLENSQIRNLIILDDIDRLSPENALLVFKVIKTIGYLPNTMFLLAYDRKIIDQHIENTYKSGSLQFLEKIVQVEFDMPQVSSSDLESRLIEFLSELSDEFETINELENKKLLDLLVFPNIVTPRDLVRLTNALDLTWDAVNGEVDPTDFIVIESIRVFQPKLYDFIKKHKKIFTNFSLFAVSRSDLPDLRKEKIAKLYHSKDMISTEQFLQGICDVFPNLDYKWNFNSSEINITDLYIHKIGLRKVCDHRYFDVYFNYRPPIIRVSKSKLNYFIQNIGNTDYVEKFIHELIDRDNIEESIEKLVYFLVDLNINVESIGREDRLIILSFLISKFREILQIVNLAKKDGIYEKKDDIYGKKDGIYEIIFTLTNSILGKESKNDRYKLLSKYMINKNIDFLVYFAGLVKERIGKYEYFPEDHANLLFKDAFESIETATNDYSIFKCENLDQIILKWNIFSEDPNKNYAQDWCDRMIGENEFISRILDYLIISESESKDSLTVFSPGEDYEPNVIKKLNKDIFSVIDPFKLASDLEKLLPTDTIDNDVRKNIIEYLKRWKEENPILYP